MICNMTRTSRNDMGKVVRDGKAYRALLERKDPWDKVYFHAKGNKKRSLQDFQWECNNDT